MLSDPKPSAKKPKPGKTPPPVEDQVRRFRANLAAVCVCIAVSFFTFPYIYEQITR